MKRRLSIIIIFALIAVLLALAFTIGFKKEKFNESIVTYLPSVDATALNETKVNTKVYSGLIKYKIIVVFDSECDYCKSQINNIIKNRFKFGTAKIIFISPEPVNVINQFILKQNIYNTDIVILSVPINELSKNFDCKTFPSTYIFNSTNKLIKAFTGEYSSEIILKEMNHGK